MRFLVDDRIKFTIASPNIGNGGATSNGGAGGSTLYGNMFAPTDFGSGGYFSAGGGAVHLVVQAQLTVDGRISSEGTMSAGPGSGGSVWIEADSFAGVGVLSVNGGPASTGLDIVGTGGGGRLAVYTNSSTFYGQLQAFGGIYTAGAEIVRQGTCGTVYTEFDSYTTLTLSNNGRASTQRTQFVRNSVSSITLNALMAEADFDMDTNAPLALTIGTIGSRTGQGLVHIGGPLGIAALANTTLHLTGGGVQSCAVQINANAWIDFTSSALAGSRFTTSLVVPAALDVYPSLSLVSFFISLNY